MHDLPDCDEDTCRQCGIDLADCTCHGPNLKWGGVKRITFNGGWLDRPIFQTIDAFVFGDDGRHLHIQMPGDEVRKIASRRVIMIEDVTS